MLDSDEDPRYNSLQLKNYEIELKQVEIAE